MNKSYEYWLNFVQNENKMINNESGTNVTSLDTLDKLNGYLIDNPMSPDTKANNEEELHDITMQLLANIGITGTHADVIEKAKDVVSNNITMFYDRSVIGDRNLNWQANLDNKRNESFTIDAFSASDSDKITMFLDKEKIKYKKEGSNIIINLNRNDLKSAVIMNHLHKISKFDELNNKNENKTSMMTNLDKDQTYSIYNKRDNGKLVYAFAQYKGQKDGKFEFSLPTQKNADPFYLDNLDDYFFIKKSIPTTKK